MSARKILPHVPPKSYTFGPDIDLCRIEAIIQHEIPARKWRGEVFFLVVDSDNMTK